MKRDKVVMATNRWAPKFKARHPAASMVSVSYLVGLAFRDGYLTAQRTERRNAKKKGKK